jgi:hypothetical protein
MDPRDSRSPDVLSLGEDEQLLWDLADEMDPEDSCLWIHGTEDQQTIAPPEWNIRESCSRSTNAIGSLRGPERMVANRP